jgi:hypothetical protein
MKPVVIAADPISCSKCGKLAKFKPKGGSSWLFCPGCGYDASEPVWHHLGWALELEAQYHTTGFGMGKHEWLTWFLG